MIKVAGTFGQLAGKDQEYAQVKLVSGEMRSVKVECRATIEWSQIQTRKMKNLVKPKK